MQKKGLFIVIVIHIFFLGVLFSKNWKLGDTRNASVFSITSSSELVEKKYAGRYVYPAAYVLDGKFSTTWAESTKGAGIGEYLTIQFTTPISFDEIQIVNGLGKNKRLYYANNRVKKMDIYEMYGQLFQLRTVILKDRRVGWQSVKFSKIQTAQHISFTIRSIYKGRTYNDTCISDIRFKYKGRILNYQGAKRLINFQEKAAKKKSTVTDAYFKRMFIKYYVNEKIEFYNFKTKLAFCFTEYNKNYGGSYRLNTESKNYFPTEIGTFKIFLNKIVLGQTLSYVKMTRTLYIGLPQRNGIYINGLYYKKRIRKNMY